MYLEVRSWFDLNRLFKTNKDFLNKCSDVVNQPLSVIAQQKTSCSLLFEETGEIVGIHLFEYRKISNTLYSRGIYLAPKYRNKGLGRQLWNISIDLVQPREIFVDTISYSGCKLIKSLKKEFRGIKWTHWNHYHARKTNAITALE